VSQQIPTRLLIMQRLTALLETLVINGVETDLTKFVFRGKNLVGDERADGPSLSILESPRPDIASFAGEEAFARKEWWTLLITGMTKDDRVNPYDPAYYLQAAVDERLNRVIAIKSNGSGSPLYPEHHLLGGLITGLEVAPPVIRPPEERVSSTAFFFLPIRVGVAVQFGKPYTTVA
jgi:hypothetical protein